MSEVSPASILVEGGHIDLPPDPPFERGPITGGTGRYPMGDTGEDPGDDEEDG